MRAAIVFAAVVIVIGCESTSENGTGFNGVGGSGSATAAAGTGGTSGAGGGGGAAAASGASAGIGMSGAGGVSGAAGASAAGANGAAGMISMAGAGGAGGAAGVSSMAGAGGMAGDASGGTGASGAGGGGELTCPSGCTAMVSACFCPPMLVDWNGAQTICTNAGMSLATIRDQATNDAIAGVIAAQGLSGQDSAMYIGLEDHATEGTFGWVSGEPLGFTHWAPDQPNNSFIQAGPEGEDCGVIQADGGWWDFPCNLLSAGFICN